MALSAQLGTLNLTPESLSTSATATLEKLDSGWTITKIHLEVTGSSHGTQAAFEAAAASAKANCPVSRLLKAEITLDAKLES